MHDDIRLTNDASVEKDEVGSRLGNLLIVPRSKLLFPKRYKQGKTGRQLSNNRNEGVVHRGGVDKGNGDQSHAMARC